jgi:short-subunit dehydrogenase
MPETLRESQTTLITGASSGLGEGMAREFASRGHDLALCARRVDRLQALAQQLQQRHAGIRISVREVDVNDAEQVAQAFDEFSRAFGCIDRIIVNAGRGGASPLGQGDVNAALQVAQTNFVGAVAQCDAAMRVFRRQGRGHLVVLSSVSAVRGMPGGMATYAASKAAVATLAEGLRNEMKAAQLPIRVTTLMPGFIHTELNAHQSHKPFAVDVTTGCRALADAIERAPDVAIVPGWPWRWIAWLLKWLPASRLPGAPAPMSSHS